MVSSLPTVPRGFFTKFLGLASRLYGQSSVAVQLGSYNHSGTSGSRSLFRRSIGAYRMSPGVTRQSGPRQLSASRLETGKHEHLAVGIGFQLAVGVNDLVKPEASGDVTDDRGSLCGQDEPI